jgi:hypothetical protein
VIKEMPGHMVLINESNHIHLGSIVEAILGTGNYKLLYDKDLKKITITWED